MTTINVKFRKSTVLDKPGTIYYQVNHAKNCKQITTSIHIYPRDWDNQNRQIILHSQADTQLKEHSVQIEKDLSILDKVVIRLEQSNRAYSCEDIVENFRLFSSRSQVTILSYMKKRIAELKVLRKFGTATNYQCALNSFTAFLKNQDLPLHAMDESLIFSYDGWLRERGLIKNSISFYMRIWRAIYNRAVKEGIVEQTHPFKNVYTGVDRTRKRAVDESAIMKLLKLDLASSPALAFSRDLFVFSYCARGMAFVDLAFLKKKNIENNVLTYYRRKTDQLLSVRIEPCIAHIIKRYERYTRGTDYVFPILTAKKSEDMYKQYHAALGYHNRKLKKIAQMAGIGIPLSSYTSRHTWATTARNHNIPISVISAGMGHTSEKTTEIYLASLENSIIDDANSGLLAEINKVISF